MRANKSRERAVPTARAGAEGNRARAGAGGPASPAGRPVHVFRSRRPPWETGVGHGSGPAGTGGCSRIQRHAVTGARIAVLVPGNLRRWGPANPRSRTAGSSQSCPVLSYRACPARLTAASSTGRRGRCMGWHGLRWVKWSSEQCKPRPGNPRCPAKETVDPHLRHPRLLTVRSGGLERLAARHSE